MRLTKHGAILFAVLTPAAFALTLQEKISTYAELSAPELTAIMIGEVRACETQSADFRVKAEEKLKKLDKTAEYQRIVNSSEYAAVEPEAKRLGASKMAANPKSCPNRLTQLDTAYAQALRAK